MGAMQLAENEKLFSFSQILRTSGMAETIESMPNVTIFAPSEAAMFCKPNIICIQKIAT
jgi:Fasciclin domain